MCTLIVLSPEYRNKSIRVTSTYLFANYYSMYQYIRQVIVIKIEQSQKQESTEMQEKNVLLQILFNLPNIARKYRALTYEQAPHTCT